MVTDTSSSTIVNPLEFIRQRRLFFHRKDLRYEDHYNDQYTEKDDFSQAIQEYRRDAEQQGKNVYEPADGSLGKTDFRKTEMQMVDVVAFQWILAVVQTHENHVKRIDQVYPEHRGNRGDFPTGNNRKRSDHERQKHRSAISDEDFPMDVEIPQYQRRRKQNAHDGKDEERILLRKNGMIRNVQPQ